MTTPQDPRKHPLQDDEIALARVLRALPAGEPPPSVDAAILAAATDAVPHRRRLGTGLRWLPTWAVGTAAAAVLAVGIGIQLRPPLAPTPPPSQPQAAPRTMAPAAPSPPAAVAMPEAAEPPAVSAASEEAVPVPFDDIDGFAPPPASAPMATQETQRDPARLDSIEVSGSRVRAPSPTNHAARIAQAEAAPLPSISEDAALPAGEWLDRIRDRRDRGDHAGARQSLALFLRAYPDAPVPGDLAHLR